MVGQAEQEMHALIAVTACRARRSRKQPTLSSSIWLGRAAAWLGRAAAWLGCAAAWLGCPAATAAPGLASTPCDIQGLTQPARCGVLDVPENPQRPEGRHLAIHVAVIPASGQALPDPIVPLMGGPGENAIDAAAYFAERFESLRKDHDLLLVDQRGTGLSGALHCDLYSAADPGASLRDVFPLAAVRRCREQLGQRADLTQYGYTHFANDLEQVRLALGYGPLNLFAASYGTRAAQVFVRTHSGSVRTAFLQSVVPIDIANPAPFTSTSQAALENTLQACLTDSACRAAFPNLRAELSEITARLDSGKVRVPVGPDGTGTALVDRGRVAEWFRLKLYRPRTAAQLPWLIHQAYLGDWKPIAAGMLSDSQAVDAELSFGLLFSITCNDDVPFVREQDLGAHFERTFLRDYRLRQQQAACRIWPKGPVPEGYRTPVTSSVPTLFASGDLDGGTPLWFTEHAAKGFSESITVIQHGQGHTEWNECLGRIYEQFIRTASVRELDIRKCGAVPRPPFKTQ
jgi:pimeloyl-ACP methyl ester carboxylesterase